MAGKKKTNVDFRNTRNIVKDEDLIASYKAMTGALHDKITELQNTYKNAGTPRRVNTQVTTDLAEALGVNRVVIREGWKNGIRRRVYLAEVTDDLGNTRFVNLDAYAAFLGLQQAAHSAGFKFRINSSYRSMSKQKALYARFKKGGALAAKPGFSRHQMGLALDIVGTGDINRDAKTHEDSVQKFLSQIGPSFGWYRTVKGEKWHFAFKRELIQASPGDQESIESALTSVVAFLSQPLLSTERTVASIVRDKVDAEIRAKKAIISGRKENYSNALAHTQWTSILASVGTGSLEKGSSSAEAATTENSSPPDVTSPYVFNFTSGLWGDGKSGGVLTND